MGGCRWLGIPISLAIFFFPLVLLPVVVIRFVKVGFSSLVLQRSTSTLLKDRLREFESRQGLFLAPKLTTR